MFGELMSGVIISIHAPRVRCDQEAMMNAVKLLVISIHAPRVRCDVAAVLHLGADKQFQSTHLV